MLRKGGSQARAQQRAGTKKTALFDIVNMTERRSACASADGRPCACAAFPGCACCAVRLAKRSHVAETQQRSSPTHAGTPPAAPAPCFFPVVYRGAVAHAHEAAGAIRA